MSEIDRWPGGRLVERCGAEINCFLSVCLSQPCVDVRWSERADGMGAEVRRDVCAGSENEAAADKCELRARARAGGL